MKLVFSGAMLTDRGKLREGNEDAVGYVLPGQGEGGVAIAVVADGMGGHLAGEVASDIAVRTVIQSFLSVADDPAMALLRSLNTANRAILAHAEEHSECAGMGTTCTALAVVKDQAWLAHIGDSRAYLLSGGVFRQISLEHSLVAALLREGTITADEAAVHPDRNVILQALGTKPEIDPQISEAGYPLSAGDRFLLCSDGLSDLVAEDVMLGAITGLKPADACRALVDAALAAGGIDNISVGVFVVETGAPDPQSPSASTRPMSAPGEAPSS